MSGRYDGSKGAATHLLQHYFRLVAQRAGVQWDSDNDVEIEAIVDGIITAAVHQVTGTVLKPAMCPACGVRLAGASGLCTECEREAGRLSYAAQARTQETQPARPKRDADAYSAPLPHYSPNRFSQAGRQARAVAQEGGATMGDLQCDLCHAHITSTYAVADENVYLCPKCASAELYKAHAVISGLRSDKKTLLASMRAQRLSRQEAQPVPVSAIAYLMADIAPVDAQDVAKQQEARATVIAWLESLEAEED